jgi:23S rRNA pseudouridine1911/1915/1917 synthase
MNLEQNILYEDSDILVLNKPAGLVVHPDGRTEEPSVSEWFAQSYPDAKDVGESMEKTSGEIIERSGVVHRIDRDTSGILLLAKTKEGHQCLKEQFQKREIDKTYHLFVYGDVKDNTGQINLPIGRNKNDFRKRATGRASRGEEREAITEFRVIKRLPDKSATFVEAKPKTGRTHQIRVHFQSINHPVVSDKLYASKKAPILGFKRLALHSRAITFKTLGGERVTIEAPYPEDFQNALDILA